VCELCRYGSGVNDNLCAQLFISAYLMTYSNVTVRDKVQLAKDKSRSDISSSKNPSAFDWFQNTQQTSQSSETESSKAFGPGLAVPSQVRTFAVPPPPTDIENLNLSQAFRASSSSSQPSADAAHIDFTNNAERSESLDFTSPYNCSVSRKESNFADSRHPKAVAFKVPYRSTKPIAKVSRQEPVTVASDQQLESHKGETLYDRRYQADNASGLSSVDLCTGSNQNTPQKPALSDGNSSVVAKSPYFQSSFSGVHASTAMTPFPRDTVSSSSSSLCDHVGDTPLALSGMLY